MDLCNERDIRALLSRHGFRFSKSLGQNFLLDPSVPAGLVEGAEVSQSCGVLEIGPGIGPLTVQLSQAAGRVVAVELDRALLPILTETLAGKPNVEILHADVMKVDLETLVKENFQGLTPMACANLPYNITTPVLTRLMDSGLFSRITVMIQREVAKRVCAQPGTPDYGAFTLYCQYHTVPEYLFEVPPEAFLPPPKVTSAVVRLTTRPAPPVDADKKALFAVIKAAFAQRRKTLLNALSAAYPQMGKEALRDILTQCGLPEDVRGERLDLAQFAALSRLL